MTSTNWKELVHPGIVKYMPENAQYKNGVPNIAAITRAGIKADESGEYNNPRVFTNEEIQSILNQLSGECGCGGCGGDCGDCGDGCGEGCGHCH